MKSIKYYRRIFYFFIFLLFLFSSLSLINKEIASYQDRMLNLELLEVKDCDEQENVVLKQKVSAINHSSGSVVNSRPILGKFKQLQSINPDIAGWIHITGTHINNPVVLGVDNEYYLIHNFYRQKSNSGTIFMDYRNRDQNQFQIIVYGHNQKDGSMFRDLANYESEYYYKAHPVITFDTVYGEMKWAIFSAYLTNTDDQYLVTKFHSKNDFITFVDERKQKSLYFIDIEIDIESPILTLSTCSYYEDHGRFVVHATPIHDIPEEGLF